LRKLRKQIGKKKKEEVRGWTNFGRLLRKSDVNNTTGKRQLGRYYAAKMMNAQAPVRDVTMQMGIKLMNMALADSCDASRNKENAKFVLRRN
jgi:hypothetical protein